MNTYALLSFFVIIFLVVVGVVVMRTRGHSFASLYDAFDKRSIFIKIPITIIITLTFLYASFLLIGCVILAYQNHVDNLQSQKENQYNALIDDVDNTQLLAYPATLRNLDQAIALMPDQPRAYEVKAEALDYQGDFTHALMNIIKAISLDTNPSALYPYETQAYILDAMGSHNAAADSLQKAIPYDPANYGLYGLLAEEQNLSAQYDQALVSINVYLTYTKNNPEAYIDRGISYFWLNQCGEAMANFRHAIGMVPSDQYLSDQLSSTTQQEFEDVMSKANPLLNKGECFDVVN